MVIMKLQYFVFKLQFIDKFSDLREKGNCSQVILFHTYKVILLHTYILILLHTFTSYMLIYLYIHMLIYFHIFQQSQ